MYKRRNIHILKAVLQSSTAVPVNTQPPPEPTELNELDTLKEPAPKELDELDTLKENTTDTPQSDFKPDLRHCQDMLVTDRQIDAINRLKAFYSSLIEYPDKVVLLNAGETINDLPKCIARSLACLDGGSGRTTLQTYIDRLDSIRQEIEFRQLTKEI